MTRWHNTGGKRSGFYADVAGRRLFVEQTVRSHCAHGIVGTEYQASIAGVRIGEFPSLDAAQNAAIAATQTKTAPQLAPRGRDGVSLDY